MDRGIKTYNLLKVLSVFFVFSVSKVLSVYHGCYQDSPVTRELHVNPGSYKPSNIDATECESLCSQLGYGYAGLTAGMVCLCGHTISSGTSGTCDATCPGDITQTCGTSDIYDSVYTAPVVLSGFKIVPASDVLETYALSTINFNLTGGTSVTFNGTVFDGGPSFGPISTQYIDYNIRQSGDVAVKASASDDMTTLYHDTVLKVQTRVKQLTLTCELTVVMRTRFVCHLTIAMGTSLTISVDMGDGTVYPMQSPDTRGFTSGQSSGLISGTSYPGDMLYLMPEHTFTSNGTIVGLEFEASSTGLIHIQVYKPACTLGYTYCPKSNACIMDGLSCGSQTTASRWKQQCGTSAVYSLVKKKCVDTTNGQVIPNPVIQDWSQIPFSNYTFAGEIIVDIINTGQQFYEVPDSDLLSVSMGDILAIKEPAGKLAIRDSTGKHYEFYYDVNSDGNWATRTSLGYNLLTTPTVFEGQHALKMFLEKPSRIKFRHTFTGYEYFYNVTATIQNNVTIPPAQAVALVEQLILISEFSIVAPFSVATNASFIFNLTLHNGTKPVYTWDFGNGNGNVTTDKYQEYIYNTSGVYTVTVTAANAVNDYTTSYVIIVQDTVQNLTVEKEHIPTIWGNLSSVIWNITQGTNVTYKADMGDGQFYIFDYPFSGVISMINNTSVNNSVLQPTYNGSVNDMEGYLSHLYLTSAFYTFTLIAENLVSSMNVTFIIPVQDLITGLIVEPTSPIPFFSSRQVNMFLSSGSHLEIHAELNGTVLNLTSFDEPAGKGFVMVFPDSYTTVGRHILEVNMTNLVSPMMSDSIEVWIDYLITNLTVDIDRPFVPVGDAVNFDIGMFWCSRFTSYIDFKDFSPIESNYLELMLEPETLNYTHIFLAPGIYSVNFTIETPVDYHNSQHDIYVQYGVKNIDVQWTTVVRIEPGAAGGPAKIWLRFMGGVPVPTAASFFINFDDNSTTTDDFVEPEAVSVPTTTEKPDCEEVFRLCTTSTINPNDTMDAITLAVNTTKEPVPTPPDCPEHLLSACLITLPPNATEPTPAEVTTMAEDFFAIPVGHVYLEENFYNVSINISNLVSSMFFSVSIDADKPIYGLTLTPYPMYVPIDTYAALNATMSWGSRATCTWDVGDGSPFVNKDCDHYEERTYKHFFPVVGVYHAKLHAENSLSSSDVSSSTGPIYVQIPVTKFLLRCPTNVNYIGPPFTPTYEKNVTFQLLWTHHQNRYPTNASYSIDFGDGTVTTPKLLPTTFQDNNYEAGKHMVFDVFHTYTRGGNYTAKINIWNLVSNENYTADHDLYEAITGLGLTILDYNPDTGIGKTGGGPLSNYYTQEHPVQVIATLERGSHVTYEWTYGDTNNNPDESYYYENEAFHMYDDDICYNVTIRVKNFHNSAELTKLICIQRGCFNISIFCDHPRGKNSTFSYQIHPGTVGSDACYLIDLTEMADPNQYIMFGNALQCQDIPEWNHIWTDPDKMWFEKDSDIWYSNKTDNPYDYNITLHSTFILEGYYTVTMYCQNKVANENFDFRVGVTKGPCWWPYVNVSAPNTCDEPMCDNDLEGLKTHYKSEKLVVKSDVNINCTATKVAYFWWQVFKVDEATGNETEIIDLNGADVFSIGARQLIIEPRTLDYGLYRFRLNVSMNEVIGMYSIDNCFIRIIPTPITVQITGGDFMMRRWGAIDPLNIDGLTNAIDPDVDASDKSGMKFIWMCRRLCETWPTFDNDWSIKTPFQTNCTYSAGDAQNDRGCSKVDGIDSSGILPNASNGILDTLYSGDMYENDEVEIRVYVIKGGRIASDTQNIYIVEGDPPILGLQCITNCNSKVNADSRYSLATYIEGWTRGVYFYYDWILYGRSWYNYNYQIPLWKWESYASTGRNGPTMAILPNCPLLNGNSSRYYYFKVKTWRWGTNEASAGWAQKTFYINEKPESHNAYVNINPSVGVAYDTKFSVRTGGFYDYEDRWNFKLYKFGYRSDYDRPYVWFHEGRYPNNYGSETPIPDGLAENGYMVEIIARAYDQVGAFADALNYVRVDPANQQDVSDMLANATSETGIVNNLFVGADIKIAPVAKCLGKFLNEESDAAPSDADIVATTIASTQALNLSEADRLALEQQLKAEREAARVRRTETRAAILSGFKRISTASIEAVQNTAAALSELTKKENEMSETAQEDSVEILKGYTQLLSKETQVSADDREETATTMVEALGNMMHAAGFMSESAEDQSTALYNGYYEVSATTPSPFSTTTLTAGQYQAIQDELNRQKTKGKEIFLKVEEQKEELIKTISKYKVVGEKDAVLESPKLNITLRKRMTINLNNDPYLEVGGHSSVLQPKSQSIFGETGNETTYQVEMEAERQTVNVYTWTDTTAGSKQKISSDVVSLKYRNDSGAEVPVQDNAQMFDIFVDRTNYETSVDIVRNITRDWNQPMVIHSVDIENTGSLHIKLDQILNVTDMIDYIEQMLANTNNTNDTQTEFALELKPVEWYVFIKAESAPTIDDYDFNCTLPLTDEAMAEMLSYLDTMVYENDTTADRSSYINERPDRYTCFYTSNFLNRNETTTYYIGIKHLLMNMSEDDPDYWLYYSTLPPTTTTTEPTTTTIVYTTMCYEFWKSDYDDYEDWMDDNDLDSKNVDITKISKWKRRACTNYPKTKKPKKVKATEAPPLPPEPAYKQAVYRLSIFSAYCIWWDRTTDQWSNEGCEVGPLSTPDRIHCLSSHLTSFAAGFAVPMNTIDLNDSAFTKLDENPIIFCTMVSLMCLYLLMCIWARKRDLLDRIMAGSSPLPDNDPRDKYLYELQVFTGARKGAGTTAKISFILTGDQDETAPRYLADEKRPVLQASNIDGFVLAVPRPLGKLTHLRIWHDNMGSSPEWYFSRMQIEDLQTGDKYFFICENWLSLDEDDGLIDRMIPVAGRAELTSFNYLFWTKAKYSLADGHLWFSIFKRPAKSNFTRIQRLTCCLSLLFATMCTSIAFYNADEGSNPKEYGVGPVTITPTGLYIGIVSGLMSLPINLLIVALFRFSKPFPKKVEERLLYRFYSKFLCLPCFKKKVKAMDEQQAEEEKNDIVGQARRREKSDLDANAVKIELENELDMLDKDDNQNKDENVKNIETRSPPRNYVKKPSAELNPVPKVLTLKKDEDKKKKPFKLPYWGIYIGYALSFCTVAVAFWATVEFGGVFGPKKSLEWLISFFISCFESIFFSQPLKVIIIAVIYAIFIKKPEANDDENEKQLEDGEEWLHTHLTEDDLKNPDKMRELEKLKSTAPLPPELDFLKTAREERQHELAMYSLLKEIAICVFFLYFILMIAYTNRDPWSYRQYNNYNNMFNLGAFSPSYTVKFEEISSIAQFWNWTENALLNSLYDTDWYNGDTFTGSSKLIQDKQTILVGSARLRQLRVVPYECEAPKNYLIPLCRDDYGYFSAEKGNFKQKWLPLNASDQFDTPDEFFTYSTSESLGGYPYWGIFSTYGGGGYVAELGQSMTDARSVVQSLMDNNWVDNNTRAIFIEVNLYNPNNNLWGVCLYVLEFLQTGGIEPFERFFIFRLDRYGNGFMYFVMAIELITMGFVIFYTVKEVRNIRKERWRYFKDFWNVWECIVLGLAYALIIVFIYRSVISVWMMRKIRDNPNTFVNFFFPVVLDECCGYFLGILAFMETLRFLRLLRFNKKVALFGSTMFYVAKPLMNFGIVFMSGFLAFSITAYFFFNTYMFDFRTFYSTIWTLLSMMLGKFDYEKAWTSTRVAGPIIFGLFALCFNFILVNFFLTIVIDGFEVVRNDLSKQSNEYEVVDHMMKKVKFLMGIDVPKKRKPGYSMDPRLNIYTYIEGKSSDQELCDKLDNKVADMIQKCNGLAEVPEQDDSLEQELQAIQSKKQRKIVTG